MADFTIPSFLENMSMDEIHELMKKHLPEDIDKSEGNHAWNLTRPTAFVAAYFAEFVIPEAIKLIFPMFAQDYPEIMDYHGETRGLERKSATYATGEITITGEAGTEIPAGSSFSTASINGEPSVDFVTTETVTIPDTGSITAGIIAEEAGMIGNVPAGTIIMKANKISGITAVTNEEETSGGTEEETTESFQARIADHDESQGVTYVGSEADYKRWALEVDGTGSAVVISPTDDSGLITIVLTDANGEPANEELREAVYNHIMRPDVPAERLAPLNGGNILVLAPETINIIVSVTIETDGIIQEDTIKKNILDVLKNYMVEAKDDREVRYTKIASAISGVSGVEDYKNLLVNEATGNITIRDNQMPSIDEESLLIEIGTV